MKRLLLVSILLASLVFGAQAITWQAGINGTYNATIDGQLVVMANVSGTYIVPVPIESTSADYFVGAGGGGGGFDMGAGGGAGGVLTTTLYNGTGSTISVSSSYAENLTVGTGGPGGTSSTYYGGDGANSSITSPSHPPLMARGGGGGGKSFIGNDGYQQGRPGGSGGGSGMQNTGGSTTYGGTGTPSQGNDGGLTTVYGGTGDYSNAGGGGYNTTGGSGSGSSDAAPTGGKGILSNITGDLTAFAGGGGGASSSTQSLSVYRGGRGGTNSPFYSATSGDVASCSGGGGGAQKNDATGNGGAGGSGIVILRFALNAGPTAAFTANKSSGLTPMTVSFNDTSIGTVTYWNVSFGSGEGWYNSTVFPATNITHIYSTGGTTYTVNWSVTNTYGTSYAQTNITLYNPAKSAFSLFNNAGTAPFTTYLYDTSTNLTPGPVTYQWDLGDGNTSTAQNLFFTWNKTGPYTVNHSVSNGLSTSYSVINVTVGTPTPPVVAPVASFYGGPQTGYPQLHVFLTDVSSNTPTSWNWSFGDGTYSTSQNPSHWYNVSGGFTVSLTATNSAGSNSTTQTFYWSRRETKNRFLFSQS
jgi:PKD repeat protein